MQIQVAAFTTRGWRLARDTFGEWKPETVKYREKEPLAVWTGIAFEQGSALVFVGAAGIAVRSIAPYVCDKLRDSPVIVMDETGRYVIPILSGHMGGANELARRIADAAGAQAVITTATDLEGVFAVDVFARRNHLRIRNKNAIKRVSGKLLEGRSIRIEIEGLDDLTRLQELAQEKWGDSLILQPSHCGPDADVRIIRKSQRAVEDCLILQPKEYVLGIGCRKGKTYEELSAFVVSQCNQLSIQYPVEIAMIATIDRKKEEPGLVKLAGVGHVDFVTYTSEELSEVSGVFETSHFVEETVGIDNVCERSAMAAAGRGATLVLKKQAFNGMTLAIAHRQWEDLEF